MLRVSWVSGVGADVCVCLFLPTQVDPAPAVHLDLVPGLAGVKGRLLGRSWRVAEVMGDVKSSDCAWKFTRVREQAKGILRAVLDDLGRFGDNLNVADDPAKVVKAASGLGRVKFVQVRGCKLEVNRGEGPVRTQLTSVILVQGRGVLGSTELWVLKYVKGLGSVIVKNHQTPSSRGNLVAMGPYCHKELAVNL
ncbi:hypothetical protein Esti_000935 [Eimeria stiedai]